MVIDVIRHILTTQVFEMSGAELRVWRRSQPGEYPAGRGETRKGWSQERAAAWIGVTARTWQNWESPSGSHPIREYAVRRIVEYTQSIDAKLDRMLA